MRVPRFLLAVSALLSITGCGPSKAEFAALQARVDSLTGAQAPGGPAGLATLDQRVELLERWLKKNATPDSEPNLSVHQWHLLVYDAICNLERYIKTPPLPLGDRLCQDTGDHGSPPNPPPWL